ncbi:MAG: helix-turn-helix transcriptional regulator [Dysgonomonas sp.]|uniref:helix-turn-helix domain-containing protein n=1 Tax=Dysgonomonas sp. TaxID=1891233 RepID=UPI00257F6089|nr:helix-turn-helix transcriptional regulator [Dysgonomonas sp.]MBS7120326.1 helix-turn-helix transcriptional regulator [Dysgonomonas sp.]
MKNSQPLHIKTISEFHRLRGFALPENPLISVVQIDSFSKDFLECDHSMFFDFYCISLKHTDNIILKYGQQQYDFDEGVMFFMSPGQIFRLEQHNSNSDNETIVSGWMLLIHPDILWNTPLAKNVKKYMFFDYSVNEALFLSEKEQRIIVGIIQNIQNECQTNIDKFSQDIIISQLEVLLNYADRFYNRQFITRKITNNQILENLEKAFNFYFSEENLILNGFPSVQDISERLNLSPNYLSSLLKITTGRNTQQHIQDKLIEIAKERISTTSLSVSEIAYQLGFEHPQSFSRIFKNKTGMSPLKFRESFN